MDADKDGYGAGSLVSVCAVNATTPPVGYSLNNTDCSPNDATKNNIFPFYVDADKDGYGYGAIVYFCAVNATTPPAGYSINNPDCKDNDATMHASFIFYLADKNGNPTGSLINICAINATTPPAGYTLAVSSLTASGKSVIGVDSITGQKPIVGKINVISYPNPSNTSFKIFNKGKLPVDLRIVDFSGKVLDVFQSIGAGAKVEVGVGYRPGIYIIEAIGKSEKMNLMLIKL